MTTRLWQIGEFVIYRQKLAVVSESQQPEQNQVAIRLDGQGLIVPAELLRRPDAVERNIISVMIHGVNGLY